MKQLTKTQTQRMNELRQKVEEQAFAFNAARAEFEAFREEICGDMQTFWDSHSDRWQDSDAGQAYQAWMQEWEEEVAEEVSENIREYPEAAE
jgi:hypothetical protein